MLQLVVMSWQRMGSSMLARLLHEEGIDMGAPFLEADKVNPRGYYENRQFLALCKHVLGAPHKNDITPRIFLEPWNCNAILRQQAATFIKGYSGVGLKCPLIVASWPLWDLLIPKDVVMIVLRRDKAANMASLRRLVALRSKQCRPVPGSIQELELYHDLCLARVNLIAATRPSIELQFDDFFTPDGQARINRALAPITNSRTLNFNVLASPKEVTDARQTGKWL